MSGIGDALRAFIVAGAAARAGHNRGREEGEERRMALMQALEERAEKRKRGLLDDEERRARTKKLEREASEPQAPTRGTPEYEAALRREEEIRARARARHRAPRERTGEQRARQDLSSVERQVDDTRSDLARAERDVPDPLANLAPKADSVSHASRVRESQERIGRLRSRADSLGGVRDSIAGVVQGRKPSRAAVSVGEATLAPPRRSASPRVASDALLMELDRKHKGDLAKIRAELRQRGFSDQ